MKILIVFFLSASIVYGENAGLRVKFGTASEGAVDKDIFIGLPTTIKEAEAKGWKETVRPPSPLPHLKLYCFINREVCPLYHPVSGFLAGLQIALPADGIEGEPLALKEHFVRWYVPSSDKKSHKLYFAIPQYFVPEDSNKFVPHADKNEILQYGGVWVKGFDRQLVKISVNENKLISNFTKQTCIPKMGTHYFDNFLPNMNCEALFPWFPLVKDGKLIGLRFMLFAHRTKPYVQREWYETLDVSADALGKVVQAVFPDAPPCFQDLYSEYKFLAMHIYYIDEPWKITCSPGDSIKPVPESILKLFL